MTALNRLHNIPGWGDLLAADLRQDYVAQLEKFLSAEKKAGAVIYPAEDNMFRALEMTPPDRVRVVILGQDPYHGPGQAHGLSFSVPGGVKLPPSLRNIYKEIAREYGSAPQGGDLSGWARQGVLLLNAALSVREGAAGSHQKKGWEQLTDAIIRVLNAQSRPVVFMLWGSYAQQKGAFIDRSKHLVLEAPHPSPLSAHRGFIGCGHFRAANDYLASHRLAPVDWLKT